MPDPKPIKYHLKAFARNGVVYSLTTKKIRRISHRIQATENLDIVKYFVRVTYSPATDCNSKTIRPINEGTYKSATELKQAWKCFIE